MSSLSTLSGGPGSSHWAGVRAPAQSSVSASKSPTSSCCVATTTVRQFEATPLVRTSAYALGVPFGGSWAFRALSLMVRW
jgi:hypothetical protein